MTFAAKGPAPGGRADPLELSSFGGVDVQTNSPPRSNTQIKSQDSDETEFDAEIACALVASGWRATAYLLINAAQLIQAGDFQNAENARQSARQQFLLANSIWRQFQETRTAEAVSLYAAEGFR